MDPLMWMAWAAFLAAAAAGGVAWMRVPQSLAIRCFAAGLVLCGVECVLAGLSAVALLPEGMLAWQRLRLLVLALLPGPWLLFSLAYARTNYLDFLRQWRVPLVAACLLPPALVGAGWGALLAEVRPVPGSLYWSLDLGPASTPLLALSILAAAFVLMNLERTLRESRGTMRWRIKFVVAGVAVVFAMRIYLDSQALLAQSLHPALESLGALAVLLGAALALLGLRRSGQRPVDLYVSTRVIFGSVAFLLAGIYLVAVGLFARHFATGSGEAMLLARSAATLFAVVLLVVLLLSDRARLGLRRLVSRHFRRSYFDYRRLWSVFQERTLHVQTPEELARAVTSLVSETFDALSVSLWLLDEDRRLHLGGSTALGAGSDGGVAGERADPGFVDGLRALEYPVDLDQAQGAWVAPLLARNPSHFPSGGHRVCGALRAGGEVVGLMAMGDRVNGLPFATEDMDLFKTLCDQAAARLLLLRLSARLLEAKQMEAFQLMSAFLVHDLKNTVSSLSLTLQNLPTYFDDPEFRRDALKTMGAGVGRMNELIRRLSVLRQKPELKQAEVELGPWLEATARSVEGVAPARIAVRPAPALRVHGDPDQLQRVVVNLLLNALEASPADRPVELLAGREDGWVVVSVRDQGCGMSAEFIGQKLFRPFQTTKKEGLGIGLFQSRRIVEAHGGRIEVESQPGQGTTFRVLLPGKEGAAL